MCARGDQSIYGIDYDETFSPVVKFTTIRMIIAVATIMNWTVFQLDVNSAYLYAPLETAVYMKIPKGFYPKSRAAGKVLKLLRALYGLKNAGRAWYKLLHDFLLANGFITTPLDTCCFIKRVGDVLVIVLVYVDDCIYTSNCIEAALEFKQTMEERFEMKDLGELKFVVGMQVESRKNHTVLHQSLYASDVLTRANLSDKRTARLPIPAGTIVYTDDSIKKVNPTVYRSKVGSLMYSMIGTRPDLAFAVGQEARHMSDPNESDMELVDQTLRYLRDTSTEGLHYSYNDCRHQVDCHV